MRLDFQFCSDHTTTSKPIRLFAIQHVDRTSHIAMSSAEAQIIYNQGHFSEPMEAQEGFARQFDLSQPDKAMDEYQKYVLRCNLPRAVANYQ